METEKVVNVMGEVMGGLKRLVDVNTVVGAPITAGGTTVIPVSKLSLGFGAGASNVGEHKVFGGGGGGGAAVTPVCFIVVNEEGAVKLLPANPSGEGSWIEKLVEAVPGVIDKAGALFEKFKKEED